MKIDRQKTNPPTIFLNKLIFPTLIIFIILLRHLLTNENPLCVLANNTLSTEILEPNLIYDHYREKFFALPFHNLLLGKNYHFNES